MTDPRTASEPADTSRPAADPASKRATVTIVVAVSNNGVIGRDGDLPWRLPSDLKRFKALTLGRPVIMGRKTWISIGRPLPGRLNIVVTRNSDFSAPGATLAASLMAALDIAWTETARTGADAVCIIGGGELYRQAIDITDILHVTHVDAWLEGDTHFPPIDPAVFEKIAQDVMPQGEKDSHRMHFVSWRRKNPAG